MTIKEDLSAMSPTERTIQSEAGPVRKPIQLLEVNDDHTFTLNDEDISKLLLREDVKDLRVVVISVAGAYRKGKSFLLDFFLRYMRANGAEDWIGDEDTPLQGFHWRGGCERDTTGILVWNEIFKVKTPSGEELAVIFMDTQGTFDSLSTVKDCATIFALSTLTSSIQVYNLSLNIQEDDLQHLQLFTEYGRLASLEGDHEGTPFQKLMFLVRDWSYPTDAPYGSEGGQKILSRRLQISEKQHPELQELRQHITSCFSSIECFLLPHPGLHVATSPEFDGRNKDIQSNFIEQLQNLVPSLLAPKNLVKKKINGNYVTCKELLEYVRVYVKIFGGNELPEPKSMLLATAEANNLAAIMVCTDDYKQNMEMICGGDQRYVSPRDLKEQHHALKDAARKKFESTRKMGGEEFCGRYLDQLLTSLDDIFESYRKQNEGKNLFAALRTPACIFSAMFGSYIASGLFSLFGIYLIANFFTLILGLLMISLIAWVYIQYSGEFKDVGAQIDAGANVLWSNVLKPTHKLFVQNQMLSESSAQNRTTSSSVQSQPSTKKNN